MESRHCPYLALPNMVSEVMSDSFLSLALPRIGYVRASRNKFIPKSIIRAEPNRQIILRLSARPMRPLCTVRRVYHNHVARPLEAHCAGPAEPNSPVRIYPTQLAPQSAKQSEPSEQIGTVTDNYYSKSPHASSWFA